MHNLGTLFVHLKLEMVGVFAKEKLIPRQLYNSSHLPAATISSRLPTPVFASIQRLPDFLRQGRLL